MKKKLLKVMFFYSQIIWKYNAISTLLGTLILKMVTNQQHITYIYIRNDKKIVTQSIIRHDKMDCYQEPQSFDREKDTKGRPLSLFALDFNLAAVSFDNGLTMKEANSHTLLLCCLKRAEQVHVNKLPGHSAPIIANSYFSPCVPSIGNNRNLSPIAGCLMCIHQQILQGLLELIPVHRYQWEILKILNYG